MLAKRLIFSLRERDTKQKRWLTGFFIAVTVQSLTIAILLYKVLGSGEYKMSRMSILCGFAAAAVMVTTACGSPIRADVVNLNFSGAGTVGSLALTVTPDKVVGDPLGAYTITGISGTFSDSNAGANTSNATISGLVPINSAGSAVGAPAPAVLSYFTVTNPPPHDTSISYDNLYYPGGSPVTCANYPASGGFLDVYGVLFKLSNNDVVDLWSNGQSAIQKRIIKGT